MKQLCYVLLVVTAVFAGADNIYSKSGYSAESNSCCEYQSMLGNRHTYGVLPDKMELYFKEGSQTAYCSWQRGQFGCSGCLKMGANTLMVGFLRLEEDSNYWIFTETYNSNIKLYLSKDWSHIKMGTGNNLLTYRTEISFDEYKQLHDREVANRDKYDPYRPENPNSTGSNGQSRSSNRNGSSGKSSRCNKCNGSGVDPSPSTGGGMTAWVAYYNADGSNCRYCKVRVKHYHNRCASCNAPR